MATAPATAAQADALIMALRGATPMQGQASTIKFYDNPQNSVYTPRERPVYGGMPSLPPGPPMGPFLPPPSAPVAPSPVAPSPSPVAPAPRPIGYPAPAPRVTDPDVPDYIDDLWGDPVAPIPDVGPDNVTTSPVYTPPLPTSRPLDPVSQPSVNVVQDLPVSTDPAPTTDPNDNFEIDRELGIVSQYDLYGPFLTASNKPTKTPSVEVVQGLDGTNTPAVNTDPADNFELDRELGIVPQYDIMEPRTSAPAPTPAPAPAQATSIRDVGNVTSVTEPLDVYYPFDESVFELIDTPPTFNAVEAPAPSALVDTATAEEIQMMNMLEDYLAQENLLASSDYWNRLNRLDDQLQQR